jgi:hypothetical protein
LGADGEARVALYLNLDAEEELARGAASSRARSAATLAAMERAAGRLAPLLPGHLLPCVPGTNVSASSARGLVEALCWCPTPGALRELRAAGLTPVACLATAVGGSKHTPGRGSSDPRATGTFPVLDVLARANERATFALTSPLVTAVGTSAVARTFEGAEEHLAAASSAGDWILRRGLSAAGRGARRVRGGARLAAGDADWLRASLALGPVTLDPRVALVQELVLHGWVSPCGATELGEVCLQRVDEHGAWRTTVRASDVDAVERPSGEVGEALRDAAQGVAASLHALHYHGPFGIDAYTWRDADGTLRLRAPSEVNARFSMGWWTGMRAR